MSDLSHAKSMLEKDPSLTCVLCKGDQSYTSQRRGIAPMMEFLDAETPLYGFSAADRIVGKAAAMLFALAGVKEVFAGVTTHNALRIFERYGISCSYDVLTDQIVNREGSGPCPMEETVKSIESLNEAREAIRETMARLRARKPLEQERN